MAGLTRTPPQIQVNSPVTLVDSREELAHRAVTCTATGQMMVLTGASGAGRTAVLSRVAQLHEGPVLVGGGLAGLRTVPNLALSRALRLPVPAGDAARGADFVVAAAGRSTLLVLDDMHLCDPATLEVVALLTGLLPLILAVTDDTVPGARLAAALARLPVTISEPLTPLSDSEALQIAGAAYRGDDRRAVRSIVRAAGGNPAALVAMAADPDASDLRLAVANRLAVLGPEARTVLCLLGLLGRPAEVELIGERLAGAAESAGVAIARDGWLTARSHLDVEVAVAVLPAEQRRALHAWLAGRIDDPAEQSRHYESAGDPASAVMSSRRAVDRATSTLERVRYQAVEARLTVGPGKAEACLRLALAAADCADHRLASSLAAAAGAPADARVGLVKARGALAMGDAAGALVHLERLAGHVEDEELTLLVALELARALCLVDPIEAMDVAANALGEARSEEHQARAGAVLGAAQLAAGAEGWYATLTAAEEHARSCGLHDVAFAAAANRCSGLLRHNRADEAYGIALALSAEAFVAGATGWAARFKAVGLWVAVHVRADLAEGLVTGEALLDGALAPDLRREVTAHVALACADGGDFELAQAHLDGAGTTDNDLLGWCDAELDALTGDRRRAGSKATAVLARARQWPVPALAAVTAAWAGVPGGPTTGAAAHVTAAATELAALANRDGHPDRAAELFTDAARRWAGLSIRSVLRCRLAAAVAFADGDRQGALVELRNLAMSLEGAELVVLSRQVARARRQLGDTAVPMAGAGPRGGVLSRREMQVLAAVADGFTSVAIAGRMGVAPSTVETQVRSAMRKLGATTRTEAAVLARR